MKKILCAIAAFALSLTAAFAQSITPTDPKVYSWPSATTTGALPGYLVFNAPADFSIAASVTGTVPSTCTFEIQSSSDGVVWSTGAASLSGDVSCASATPLTYTVNGKSVPYVRVNIGTLTGADGTTRVNFFYTRGQSGGSNKTSIDGQTGAFTFSGSGVSHNGLSYTFNGGGGGGGNSVTLENVYSAPGSFTFTHGLNSIFYQVNCLTRTGPSSYAPATVTNNPVDANNAVIAVPAAGDYICSFSAASALSPDFLVAASPTSQTYWPTMSGTQQPTFTINQTALAAYTGTANYTVSGLASGMTGAFSPTSITGTGSSVLTLSFPANQAVATTSFTVQGADGTRTHTASPSITIGNINSGLVECWAMNDGGTSTTFANSCGTGNTQTKQAGTFTWGSNAGLPGSTATFSATAYSLGTNQTATNFDGTTPFSVSAWINIGAGGTSQTIISTLDVPTGDKGWEFLVGSNKALTVFLINTFGSNFIQVGGNSAMSTNALHYVVMTYDGSRSATGVKQYVDGVLQAVTIAGNNLSATIANTKIPTLGARTDGTDPMNGLIAYTRIYNRVLSQTDVTNYFAAGAR